MNLALTIIHVVISLVLVVVVLMQHGKQQGLSGAIAGGAETFFGKNKGRTIDAMLKKFTAVLAVLFVGKLNRAYGYKRKPKQIHGNRVTTDRADRTSRKCGRLGGSATGISR